MCVYVVVLAATDEYRRVPMCALVWWRLRKFHCMCVCVAVFVTGCMHCMYGCVDCTGLLVCLPLIQASLHRSGCCWSSSRSIRHGHHRMAHVSRLQKCVQEKFWGLENKNGGASGCSFRGSSECSDWLGKVLWSSVLQNSWRAAMNPYLAILGTSRAKLNVCAECMIRHACASPSSHACEVSDCQIMLVRFLKLCMMCWVTSCAACAFVVEAMCRMQNQLGMFFILAMILPSDCEL
jgi:hypothetical protein